MKIAINTLSIFPGQIGGGETYLVNLLRSLEKIDNINDYYLFVNKKNHYLFPSSKNFQKIFCQGSENSRPLRISWEQFVLPRQIKDKKIDILFSPANISPVFFLPCKSVLTIQDLCWVHFGEYLPWNERKFLKFLVTKSAKKANKIITPSESTKREIISYLGIKKEKIITIYLAPSEFFRADKESNKIRQKNLPEIGSEFILTLGTTHHHKNFSRLLEAYLLLKKQNKSFKHKLILAGMPGRAHSEIIEKVKNLKLEKDVIIKGRISDEELKPLYYGADLFVLPSLCEGFGIPVLEAMACGIPVVSSNSTSLPEVVGDAGLLFDPCDINDMIKKIRMVLEDPNFQQELKKKGFERVQNFSWEKAAKQTLETFKEVFKS